MVIDFGEEDLEKVKKLLSENNVSFQVYESAQDSIISNRIDNIVLQQILPQATKRMDDYCVESIARIQHIIAFRHAHLQVKESSFASISLNSPGEMDIAIRKALYDAMKCQSTIRLYGDLIVANRHAVNKYKKTPLFIRHYTALQQPRCVVPLERHIAKTK